MATNSKTALAISAHMAGLLLCHWNWQASSECGFGNSVLHGYGSPYSLSGFGTPPSCGQSCSSVHLTYT